MKKAIFLTILFIITCTVASVVYGVLDVDDFGTDLDKLWLVGVYDGEKYYNIDPEKPDYTTTVNILDDKGKRKAVSVYCDYISYLKQKYEIAEKNRNVQEMMELAIAADEYRMYVGVGPMNNSLIKRLQQALSAQ